MAHLEVEPKPKRPWWLWALIALVLIALAAMVFKQCNQGNEANHAADAADTTISDSTNKAVAATIPDWNSVDFNTERTQDADIRATDIYTQTNGTYTIYTLGENILFGSESNAISNTGADKLKMISDVLTKRFEGATIGIFGSADASGPAAANKELGMQRAEAVKNWFTQQGDIPQETISVRSLGETQPVATNSTEEGRQQNRNVAIVIFPRK